MQRIIIFLGGIVVGFSIEVALDYVKQPPPVLVPLVSEMKHPEGTGIGTPMGSYSPYPVMKLSLEETRQKAEEMKRVLATKQEDLTYGEKWQLVDEIMQSLTFYEKWYMIKVVKDAITLEEQMRNYDFMPLSPEEQKQKREERNREFALELENYDILWPDFAHYWPPPVGVQPTWQPAEIKPPPDQKWGELVQGESISIWSDKTIYGFAEPIIIYGQSKNHEDNTWVRGDRYADLCERYVPDVKYQSSLTFDEISYSVFPTDYSTYPFMPNFNFGIERTNLRAGEVSRPTYTYLNRHFDMTRSGTYFIKMRQTGRSGQEEPSAESNELKITIIDKPSTTLKTNLELNSNFNDSSDE